MSPRRKSGLSKDDIEALKELPRVLKALENLQEQHAKVRALMGDGAQEMERLRPRVRDFESDALYRPPPPGETLPEASERIRANAERLGLPTVPRNPTLDTPERREYEEAKRAGRKVPVADPFANASPAQRERMAEQRAIIDAERAARGLPTRTVTAPRPSTLEEVLAAAPDEEAQVVRTETLDTVSDGTTPLASDADDDPEVH